MMFLAEHQPVWFWSMYPNRHRYVAEQYLSLLHTFLHILITINYLPTELTNNVPPIKRHIHTIHEFPLIPLIN